MTKATELLADAQALAQGIQRVIATQAGQAKRDTSPEALDLIRLEIGKLTLLATGRSPLPEWSVYLSVSSLNKGLIEIGGDWREDRQLVALAEELTQKAYQYYKDVRPAI